MNPSAITTGLDTSATVDVLLSVYNGATTIRSAVESMQRQTLHNLRIVVVDDGSLDDTPRILDDMATHDPRVYVLTKPNGGLVEALNYGLEQCRAEFIARHDADDLAYPNRLADQVQYLRDHPDCLAVGGSARHIDGNGKRLGTIARFPPPSRSDPSRVPAIEPYLLHPFLMVRTAAIKAVGGYREAMLAEDSDLYWRLQERGHLHNDPAIQGEYRLHTGSISSQSIESGRRLAVGSQVCALSAARRRAGKHDFDLHKLDTVRMKQATSLSDICAVFYDRLNKDEARHLRLAASVKLLEVAGYRPYEVEMEDCVFLRAAYEASWSSLSPSNRALVNRNYSGTAARLLRNGKWREARALIKPSLYGAAAGRLTLRLALPRSAHARVRHAVMPLLARGRRS